jgi:DNA (cytosine-5)-methyltransferase 1
MDTPLRILSLCSGVGGLELGIAAAEPAARVVGYVERDAYAAGVLLARMEESALERAPVWCGEIAELPLEPFAERVDCVTAGFPCQPFSVAGARKRTSDERWIWPDIARVLLLVRPRLVFLENVPALASGGLGPVLGDLASLGFDAEWTVLRASDVGAPHQRARMFILAWHVPDAGGDAIRERAERGGGSTRQTEPWNPVAGDVGEGVADADSAGCDLQREAEGLRRGEGAPRGDADGCTTNVGDAAGSGREGRFHGAPSGGVRSFPPGSDTPREMWPGWCPQPAIRRGSNGSRYRLDRLRCLGNAVVPQQAALAWRVLWARRGG